MVLFGSDLVLSPVILLSRWFGRSVSSVCCGTMEEVGRRFAGSLVLTERESKGVRIRASALQCLFAVVCKVVTPRSFRRRSFIDLFTRLWGGKGGVVISDVEDDRFLLRFSCEADMAKVLEREPWDFDRSLILMGVLREEEAVTAVDLKTAVFWVQIHGVPLRFRTPEVVEDIGSVVGGVVDVGRFSGEDCVGRFLRVRVRMDVTQPLLRRTVVPFPGIGDREIDFRYEHLPEFCQECGLIGHPTRVCDERLGFQNKKEEDRPYKANLRAEYDIHGRRLGPRGGKGRWDGISGGSGTTDSRSGSVSRSVGNGSGEQKDVAMGVDNGALLLEGPLQDTATSPCK